MLDKIGEVMDRCWPTAKPVRAHPKIGPAVIGRVLGWYLANGSHEYPSPSRPAPVMIFVVTPPGSVVVANVSIHGKWRGPAVAHEATTSFHDYVLDSLKKPEYESLMVLEDQIHEVTATPYGAVFVPDLVKHWRINDSPIVVFGEYLFQAGQPRATKRTRRK